MSDSAKSDNVGAYYVQGRIDDTSVNIIKINPDFANKGMTQMYTTLAHEGYPGHLYQFTASNANKDIPNVRKILSFMGATEAGRSMPRNVRLITLIQAMALRSLSTQMIFSAIFSTPWSMSV